MKDTLEITLNEIIFRDDLYPRIETSAATVQQYAEDLSVLPPIEINQHNELIDGWHRWTAHKKRKAETIRVTVTETANETELLELAIERNAQHGLQLSKNDKQGMARRIYHITPDQEREAKKKHLAAILSVPERTIREWLSRIDKDSKEARDRRIFDLWLSCHTQQEIAQEVGCSKTLVNEVCSEMADLPKANKPASDHITDFETPAYNVWKQQKKTPGSEHFGNSEIRWVDNLLYLYTKPFDVVVDPFAGGGSTIDICRKRFRRYWVSDRKVEPELEGKVRLHDLTDGLPALPRWKDVTLVYLDPPYWKQAEGRYSDDPEDFANMPLGEFTDKLANLIKAFSKKLPTGATIALLIQPTQWNAPEKQYTDHIADLLRIVKLPLDIRISCPYESQQHNAQMVAWAKENRKLLVLSREMVVWMVP
jgi:hypothetical protein